MQMLRAAVGMIVLVMSTAQTGLAQQAPGATEPSVLAECARIATADFSKVPEAPAQIFQSVIVEAHENVPATCEVRGVVVPNVGFTLKLPTGLWNGRFFEAGCGGWCGADFDPKACDAPLHRGYACIVTDAGHLAPTVGGLAWTRGDWAFNNVQTQLDYGGRASHVAAVIGKAISTTFYGKKPEKAYFMGCSYGGHQSMVLAQRYPWDFDGIVGGGVPNNLGGLMQQNMWALRHGFDKNHVSVFSDADIEVLHNAVLARCDMDDGVKDGIVGNPVACKVRPKDLVCKAGATSGCLSEATASAAEKMYSGPTNSRGEAIAAGGWMPGSELYWRQVYSGRFGGGLALMAENYFRFMNGVPSVGPGWTPDEYDFDNGYKRNDVSETLYAADNPNLARFKAAGGKFITYAGWSDLGALPDKAIEYYEAAQRTMGGPNATKSFFRLFAIPGALHCQGGDGAGEVDFLTYIENWVERGDAPEVMIGSHRDRSGHVTFTRPLYPYPKFAKYKGNGDPNDAVNFKPESQR